MNEKYMVTCPDCNGEGGIECKTCSGLKTIHKGKLKEWNSTKRKNLINLHKRAQASSTKEMLLDRINNKEADA